MKRPWLTILLSLFFGLGAVGFFLFRAYRNPGQAFATPQPLRAATPAPTATLSPEERLQSQADGDFMAGRVNILLLGFDQSPERDEAENDVYRGKNNGFRSDVMLLMAVNFEEKSVHLISIPRDTYAKIYNTRGRYKINAAFAKGGGAEEEGFAYARHTVELLLGVPVDYYLGVNMEGLKHVVNAIGGVDYDVDVKISLNGRVLEKGYQHLNGQQVLDYCRARKGISTDVGRNDRQQRMLLAIYEKLRSEKRITTVPKLYTALKNDLYTNLSLGQIAALASLALELPGEQIRRSTLEGEYISNVYNASYYVLDNAALEKLVKEEFGIDFDREDKYDLKKVKRDKAAALAREEAERAARAAQEADVETGALGSWDPVPLETLYLQRQALEETVRSGGSHLDIYGAIIGLKAALEGLG